MPQLFSYDEAAAKMADMFAMKDSVSCRFCKYTQWNCGLKCQCCAKCKLELTKVTSELKSAMKIIEILKKERRMDDMLLDKVRVKLCNSEEGISLSLNNENWTQMTANPQNKNTCKLSKSPSTTLRSANRLKFCIT